MAREGPLLILRSKGQRPKEVKAKLGKFEFVSAEEYLCLLGQVVLEIKIDEIEPIERYIEMVWGIEAGRKNSSTSKSDFRILYF